MSEKGAIECFKQINILYGRNYSGKTTLSRIVRALETGALPPNYASPQFSVLWDNNNESTANDLLSHEKTIRVFNEDFVRENLDFLTDSSNPQGQIKSFAVIGADNVQIENKIQSIETELGCAEEGKETGLYADLEKRNSEQKTATDNHQTVIRSLKQRKEEEATHGKNSIKQRHAIFGDINYNVTKLDNDIKTVLDTKYSAINDAKRQELEQRLNEEAKAEISALPRKPFEFTTLCNEVKTVIEKKIGDSGKIPELVREYALNEWVRQGCKLHKDKREECAFCGSKIAAVRWAVLEKHFDEETEKLEQKTDRLLEEIETQKDTVDKGFTGSKDSFYTKFHTEVTALIAEYKTTATHYCEQLNLLTSQLEKRKQAITQDFVFVVPSDISNDIESVFARYEELCKQSNTHTENLANSKNDAQNTLRLHEVKTFIDTIGYVAEIEKINNLDTAKNEAGNALQAIQKQIDEKKQAIEDLKRRLNDEEKGALKVNEYLNHGFGHQFLTLKAVQGEEVDSKKIRFEIMRGDQKALNLSEGECSLVAFCYFMAKLDDVSTSGKKPIIWIDDPISSLDGNHIFFAYSLLCAEIVDKKRFEQLFVSTHNLEFLKYLKRITGKDSTQDDKNQMWLIIERKQEMATIKPMPNYLKEYITEFNYLFHQIYKCAQNSTPDDSNYSAFFNFGNNARKFLEIYLYYRYPDRISHNGKISKMFGDKVCSFLADRLNNEQSHLSGSFERGAQPVDIPEMQSVVKLICDSIKKYDDEQYSALLNSIGESPVQTGDIVVFKYVINHVDKIYDSTGTNIVFQKRKNPTMVNSPMLPGLEIPNATKKETTP
ncbi:MAG: AAA family ATPase [Bacteroidales bacterium]|nr:AAA family ATPase [Bacteroidales bacterium]